MHDLIVPDDMLRAIRDTRFNTCLKVGVGVLCVVSVSGTRKSARVAFSNKTGSSLGNRIWSDVSSRFLSTTLVQLVNSHDLVNYQTHAPAVTIMLVK